jgi:hypothetical protein
LLIDEIVELTKVVLADIIHEVSEEHRSSLRQTTLILQSQLSTRSCPESSRPILAVRLRLGISAAPTKQTAEQYEFQDGEEEAAG